MELVRSKHSPSRGVVLLSSSWNGSDLDVIGMLLLKSEWQSEKRPKAERFTNCRKDDSRVTSPYSLCQS